MTSSPRYLGCATAILIASLALGGCSKPEEKEARYLKRGNELFEDGQFDKARIEYKNAGRIKPADPEVAYRMGLVDEAQGNLKGAFDSFTRAEQQNAQFHPATLKLAEYYLAGDHEEEAQKRIENVLAQAPDDPTAHALRGAILLRSKDYAGAEKEARQALEKDPKNVIAYTVLTGLYSAQNDDAKAIAAVDDGIAHNPKNLQLYLLKSQIYERENDFGKLADTFEQIFKLAPDDPRYRVNLAAIYLKAGQIDNAEKALRDGIKALPGDWNMKRQLIAFLGDHRGLDAAEKEIRDLIRQYPDRAELTAWLVDLYVSHNETDRAIKELNDVIARNTLDERGLDARTAMARIKYLQGDRKEALRLAEIVLQNAPNNLDARYVKARVEFDQGAYQDAVTDLRIIVRDQPRAKEALGLLAETLMMQGHLDLAIDTMNNLVDLDTLNFPARVRLAQMYHRNGDSRHAMDILFFVTKTAPTYPVGWESTARIAIDTKDFQTAEAAIEKLDALQGQHNLATFLRGLMLEKSGKTEAAIDQYKSAASADPNAAVAEHALAALVAATRKLNKPEEATRYIESLKSSNPAVNTILGESYLATGNMDRAAAGFDDAINGNAVQPEPYIDRARMFLYDHKIDEALQTLKKGITAVPNDTRLTLMQAEILGGVGRYQEAIALYQNLLDRNPELDAVANNLAEIIADYQSNDPGSMEKARHIAERFVASQNPLFLDTLAWVYYRMGNNDQALGVMQRAMTEGDKMPPQAHYHYGAMLLKAGKTADAKTELGKATVEGARYPGIEDAKKMLADL